ncbi:hypothetical protein [Streptomyces sp. NPDC001978]|uniref:hypothetical protein n=1 Tax=Streptomyces sp. NPDC001978 TaxID=3364627 RepID=UPI0036C59B74
MSGARRSSVVAVLMGGILLLTGCHQGASASGTPSGTAASSTPDVSVTAEPTSDASPSAASSGSTTTPVPSHTSAATTKASAVPTRTHTHPAPVSIPGCRNLTVSAGVKAAVTEAYKRSFPRFSHIRPVPHHFFYGQCGAVHYAAARFQATPGATYAELVGMQDEGSATKYFRTTSGGGWIYIASDGFPQSLHGCGDIAQIPRALAAAWGNCRLAY